jgi:2-keto-4-pentenoate hydratase/2-oxohepta-3-ene-1,7-dioic acid hydratase in catechol pathway
MLGKTFDTFAPMGPAIVTADEIADPHALNIRLDINGETLQDSNTKELNVISTGTPSGVGFSYTPPRWLTPGDVVTVTIEGVGALSNPCIAEA